MVGGFSPPPITVPTYGSGGEQHKAFRPMPEMGLDMMCECRSEVGKRQMPHLNGSSIMWFVQLPGWRTAVNALHGSLHTHLPVDPYHVLDVFLILCCYCLDFPKLILVKYVL